MFTSITKKSMFGGGCSRVKEVFLKTDLPNVGLTRNYLYDTICMTLIRFLYERVNWNLNV